jgi:superfamily II DNA or RNA helicase
MSQIALTDNGATIPWTHASIITDAKKALTQYIEKGFQQKYQVPVRLYEITKSGVHVPNTFITSNQSIVYRDDRTVPYEFHAPFRGELRPGQRSVSKKAIIETSRTGCATLVMPTGSGKTVCALYIAAALRMKPIILVHKNFLVDQWSDRINAYFGNDVRVTFCRGGEIDTSGDIVVGLIQTFVSKCAKIPTCCGTLIIDEAHHIAATQFRRVVTEFMTNQRVLIGLTATPERKDGLDIARITGQFIEASDSLPDSVQSDRAPRVSVEQHIYSVDTYTTGNQPTGKHGDVVFSSMITAVAKNNARTIAVCNLIAQYKDRDILVLSHRRAHCEAIFEHLREAGVDVALFLPSRGKRKRPEVPTAKIIVSTFSYVSEGLDIPRLNCIVFATPASNLKQSIGRILRRRDNAPLVIDVCDTWGILVQQTHKRTTFYRKNDYVIRKIFMTNRAGRTHPVQSTSITFCPDDSN